MDNSAWNLLAGTQRCGVARSSQRDALPSGVIFENPLLSVEIKELLLILSLFAGG